MNKYLLHLTLLIFLLSYIVFAQFDYDLFETVLRSIVVSSIFAISLLLIILVYKSSRFPEETEQIKKINKDYDKKLSEEENFSLNLHQDEKQKEKK